MSRRKLQRSAEPSRREVVPRARVSAADDVRLHRQPRLCLAVAVLALAHAALALHFHHDRAWQRDEWGSYAALRETYGHLLTHFEGWQTMNFYLSGLKAVHQALGATNWLLVLPGVLCGVWLVGLTAALALRVGVGVVAAATAALLVAVNPFLVIYSVTIRSYIHLAAFSTAMMVALWDWRRRGGWRDGVLCGLAGALALLAHLNAVYTVGAVAVVAACWTIAGVARQEPDALPRAVRLAVPGASLLGLAAVAYLPQLGDIVKFRPTMSAPPPIPLTFVPTVLSLFFGGGRGTGYLLVPVVAALVYGAWRVCHDHRPSQWLLLSSVIVVAEISLAGVSYPFWSYARFLIATLPWLAVVLADGLWARPGPHRLAPSMAVGLVALVGLVGLGEARQRQHARPWHHVIAHLQADRQGNEHYLGLGLRGGSAAFWLGGLPVQGSAASQLASLPRDIAVRLVVVDGTGRIPRGSRFGDLRVFTVTGPPAIVADKLLHDLTVDAADRVVAELQPVYAEMAALARWLGREAEAHRFEIAARDCALLDPTLQQQTSPLSAPRDAS